MRTKETYPSSLMIEEKVPTSPLDLPVSSCIRVLTYLVARDREIGYLSNKVIQIVDLQHLPKE